MTGVLVLVGGFGGAAVRYLLGRHLDRATAWGTLTANLAGSLLMGYLTARAVDGWSAGLVGTGFCGGLTTWSSFAVQTVRLPMRQAAGYALATLIGCLVLAGLGWQLG